MKKYPSSENIEQESIFSSEELEACDAQSMFGKAQPEGPVTCLGIEFANDDERRAYFRERLREKLPELRHIEGFPIGSDDDIINLSDPPYYTACPNPWLNDFIAEWEAEKKQLEVEGKRRPDFEVTEPYAADISEGKNNPIYMAHAYHTKVPHPAIMRYILHYTQPGDIVFDGFAGTGMTGVAANLCSSSQDVKKLGYGNSNVGLRHSICTDLSPIATAIASNYILPFNVNWFVKKATEVLNQVEKELGWMYETTIHGEKAKVNYVVWSDTFDCPSCSNEIILWNESVSLADNKIKDSFSCPHCGYQCSKKNMKKQWVSSYDKIIDDTTRFNKKVPVRVNYTLGTRHEHDVQESDIRLIESIDFLDNLHYKTQKFPLGYNTKQPIDSNGVLYTHQFYSKRNFIILSRVLELVRDYNLPVTWFTSVLQRTTLGYKFTLDRKFGILTGTLYIPSLNVELNPFSILKRKIKDFSAIDYPRTASNIISVSSATKLAMLDSNSIDYIFIDPPFGSNIMYSELSSVWEGWLGVSTNNKEEAIVNDYQQKKLQDYQRLMWKSFAEFFRILKPGKWITIEFSNTSASVWNAIQTALQNVGFVVANVAALDKKQGSFKAVTTTTAVKQDLIISCFKPTEKMLNLFNQTTEPEKNVWDFVGELLEHLPVHIEREQKTTSVVERSPKILYDRLISYYVQRGFPVPLDAGKFQEGLRERFVERDGMYFTAEQAARYDEMRKNTEGFQATLFFVDSEQGGIGWLNNELGTEPQTYQVLMPKWMQAIQGLRKGDILPELKQILEENFIQEADGKWRKPNLQDDIDLNLLRNKSLMREFKVYVEIANKPKGKIKEARIEALRAGFKQCYVDKDFETIVKVGDHIPANMLQEDDVLLQYYDIALNKVNV